MNDPAAIIVGSAEGTALLRLCPDAVRLYPEDAVPQGIRALVDARHPMDRAGHWRSWRAANARGLPYLRLERPGYAPRPGDRWIRLRHLRAAAALVPRGARVLATTGGEDYAALSRFAHARIFIRRRSGRAHPPVQGAVMLPGEGPFTIGSEMALMRRLGIDLLITRDAGGEGSYPKLAAARRLNIPVILISRAPAPPGRRVRTVQEAASWLVSAGS
jgi:precorrin-6A/cobalt-precorrin-6A reductase